MKICAGIITYNPDIDRLKKNILAIYIQVDKVYIFDNHSNNVIDIVKLCEAFSNVVLLREKDNYGIAYALNFLCSTAIYDAYDWILTLDQDSISPNGLISTMKNYISDEIGILCPAIYYDGIKKNTQLKKITEEVSACMTSASLTNLAAYKKVDGFNNDYFIDFVDNEYCMKLRLNNYKIIKVNKCVLNHQLGDTKTFKFLFIKRNLTSHKPWRLYYMARNNYNFIKKYKKYLNYIKEKIKLYYVLFFEYIVSSNKKEAKKYIKKGLKDGKKGILGKMSED